VTINSLFLSLSLNERLRDYAIKSSQPLLAVVPAIRCCRPAKRVCEKEEERKRPNGEDSFCAISRRSRSRGEMEMLRIVIHNPMRLRDDGLIKVQYAVHRDHAVDF